MNISTDEFTLLKEFVIENGNVYCGSFLFGGRFLFVNYSGKETCLIYDLNWDCIQLVDGLKKPYGAVQWVDEIFVTNSNLNTVDLFSSDDLHKLRNFRLNHEFSIWGMTCWRGNLYVACLKQISKLDRMGEILQKYEVNGSNISHITTTKNGLIVYSDWKKILSAQLMIKVVGYGNTKLVT